MARNRHLPALGAGAMLGLLLLPACSMTDRGISRIQVEDELILGSPLDEVRDHWYWYSKKRLQIDPLSAQKGYLTYRGVSHDPGVTSFILYFSIKTKDLRQIEWRYRPSLTEIKSQELLHYWTGRLKFKPSIWAQWGGKVYVWADRKAKLELVVGEGICHLRHRLR
jgi:hypothetical protein